MQFIIHNNNQTVVVISHDHIIAYRVVDSAWWPSARIRQVAYCSHVASLYRTLYSPGLSSYQNQMNIISHRHRRHVSTIYPRMGSYNDVESAWYHTSKIRQFLYCTHIISL